MIKGLFKCDSLVRGTDRIPIGRVILNKPYVEGENVEVVLLSLLKNKVNIHTVRGMIVYIDGEPYKIPEDLNDVKIISDTIYVMLNHFVLIKC